MMHSADEKKWPDANGCRHCGRSACTAATAKERIAAIAEAAWGRSKAPGFDRKHGDLNADARDAIRSARSETGGGCQNYIDRDGWRTLSCDRRPAHTGMHVATFEGGDSGEISAAWTAEEAVEVAALQATIRECAVLPAIDWQKFAREREAATRRVFVLSCSYHDEYGAHVLGGPSSATPESFQRLCDSLLPAAVERAVATAEAKPIGWRSWIGWSEITEAMVPLLAEHGFALLERIEHGYFGPGIIRDESDDNDNDRGSLLDAATLRRVSEYNAALEREDEVSGG